jgi:hypothetical protein
MMFQITLVSINTANTNSGETAKITKVSCQPLTKLIVTPAMNVAKKLTKRIDFVMR